MLRIWDCLFNEGSKIIFRVALTLIKQHQAFILEATSFADICEKFKEITKGNFVTECHTFMQVSVWECSAGALLCGSHCLEWVSRLCTSVWQGIYLGVSFGSLPPLVPSPSVSSKP